MWWRTRRAKVEALDAELQAHIALATQERINRGETPRDAERHARREFGNAITVREATSDQWAGNWIDVALHDFRYAIRALRRAPAFCISATITLAIGIGAVTAMFAVVHGVLLKPLPYADSDKIVQVAHEARSGATGRISQSPGAYLNYQRRARTAESIGLYRVGTGNIWTDSTSGDAEQVTTAWLTASIIPMLQVSPLIGRTFTQDEDQPTGATVILISESLWRSRYGASRDVLGKTLYVNSVKRQIIGVMPDKFRFPSTSTRIWLPTRLDANTHFAGDFGYSIVARLRRDVPPSAATQDFASALSHLAESFPTLEADGISTAEWLSLHRPTPIVTPLRDVITGDIGQTLWMLAAAASLVLLVACASVANLKWIRIDTRRVEFAVRAALGAGRFRVITQLLIESSLLSAIAATIGLTMAWTAVQFLVAYGPADIPRLAEVQIGGTTILFALAIAVLADVIAAIIPILHAVRTNAFSALREGGRSGTPDKARLRLRRAIAGAQIALALVTLIGSGLLIRTFQQLQEVRLGFDPASVTTLWMQLPFARYQDSSVVQFNAALVARVAALPMVDAAGITSRVPLVPGATQQNSYVAEAGSNGLQRVSLQSYNIDDGYLKAMHIPLIAGRRFDRIESQRDLEVIVNRTTASVLWNDSTGQEALGKHLKLVAGGPSYLTIGVVGDVRDEELSVPPAPTIYYPQTVPTDAILGRRPQHSIALVVRTSVDRANVVASVRRALHDLDPTLPIFNVQAMSDAMRASTSQLSLTLSLVTAAAFITLLLGAVGLYGVTASSIALRRRELGLRIALGADPNKIVRMMTRQGLSLALWSVGAGLLVFAAISQSLKSFVYGVAPIDPIALIGASFTLLLIATFATWLPARRIARFDPADSLRAE